jgi:hypothetical protein
VDLKDRSFTRKILRAGRHLEELSEVLNDYADRHPYEIVRTERRGKYVHTFTVTEAPPDEIPLIVGDVLYNLRSGFDHLIGALVQRSQRSKVLFPIVHEPVWSITPKDGENADRTRNREKWDSLTAKISNPAAVPVLQTLQPIPSNLPPAPGMHVLDILNKLSNKDRHSELSVIVTGMHDPKFKLIMRGGQPRDADDGQMFGPNKGMKDQAELPVGDDVAYVKVRGKVITAVRIPSRQTQVLLPDSLASMLQWMTSQAILPLAPYVID